MLSSKVRAVLATLGRSESAETRQTQTKITVIFMVAIAVRKFQKFESDKFKKSLTFYFDKRAAPDKLRCLFDADGSLSRKENFIKLAYFVRKFNLTFEDLSSVGLPLVQMWKILNDDSSDADEKTMYFLCLALKYLTRNSDEETNPLEISLIVQLIGTNCNRLLVKNELVALLLYRFEKLNVGRLDSDQSFKLESMIVNTAGLNQDVRALILGKFESSKAADRCDKQEQELTKRSMAVRKVKKNQQVVSKTIQTVKAQQETKSSEEVEFEFLNLSDCMKNRNIRLNCNTVYENLDSIEKRAGSDRSILHTTWAEMINLYSLVSQSQVLKDTDKDNYLPNKFLGYHYFTGTFRDKDAAKMYSFFINRMAASIYAKVTQKQQLNSQAIDGLMKCIVDFDSLVSVLDLDRDYVKMLVDKMFQRYWDLKKTSPDIVNTFFKKVANLTTEEYLSRGWVYNTTEVRQKSYNRDELEKIIRFDINSVRLDAIKALYKCAVRDKNAVLTESRVKTITNYAKRKDDKTFTDYIFKLMELAETLNDFNYKEAFEIYLNLLNPKSTERLDNIFRFLTNQARDMKRCQDLFDEEVMTKLIGLVGRDSGCEIKEKRMDVLEIINVCLEHEGTKGLSEKNLQMLLDYCFESNETSLINAGLTSLLLSTDKNRCLSPGILNKLFAVFDQMNLISEEITSYIVFILSRVFCADDEASKKFYLNDQSFVESVSNKMLCEHIVRLNDGDNDAERIKFYTPSGQENTGYNHSNKISLIATKIIARSVENKVKLSSVTIDNLLLVLQCNNKDDKQTMILASKCLYGLSKYMALKAGNLNQLLDLINSSIYDVSVYIQTAYLKECVKVAYAPDCLNPIHLENISALYVQESLNLSQHDYEPEINNSLFKTLLYEARKQKFADSNIFLLFDNILNLNGKYVPKVLRILVAYSQKFLVPEATVRILENLLSVSSYFEQALLILQSFVLNGGSSITSKTFTVFADYLSSSSCSRVRFNSFKLLERVSQTQELPDNIFCRLELVRAAYAMECRTTDKQSVIEFVQSITEKGIHLPVDAKLSLEKEITYTDVLKIFANVSKRKQIIEQHLLDALIQLFKPSKTAAKNHNNKILITIFENAAKNNQSLPRELLKELEKAFRLKDLEQSVLPLFIYLAQKGENLSRDVNDKLLDRFASEPDPVLKQELLSSLGSLIVAQKEEIKYYQSKINQILKNEIASDNFNIQKLCFAAIGKMVMVSKQLDDKLLKELIEIGTDLNCNRTLRSEIQSFFDSIEDSCNPLIKKMHYREKIKLANLSGISPRHVLDQICGYPDSELLVQNYKQLKEIIDNEDGTLQEDVLNMLLNYRFKSKMTDELLESIAILFESTMSQSLSNSCLNLFNLVVKSGKTLSGRARDIWNAKLNKDENIKKLLRSSVCREIQRDFQLDNQVMLDLLELIQESAKIDDINDLTDLIQLIVKEKSDDYFKSPSFVLLIEGCLLKRRVLEEALPYYCRIIKEQKYGKVQQCLQELVQYFSENLEKLAHLETVLFESMYYANNCLQLSDSCMELVVDNVANSNEIVRWYSFGILRTSKNKHQYEKYASDLTDWCNVMIESLAQNMKIEIPKSEDYMDLLEIIVSVKFLDVAAFTNEKRDMWKQELLVSSIFECFKVFQIDQINFFTHWSTVVDKFCYHKSCKILLLIHNSSFDTFSQILELTVMMPELTFDDVIRMLTIYAPEPYEAFKQDWCTRKIVQSFTSSNKDGISAKYSSKLAKKLCFLFDVSFIGKLFRCFKLIDNLSAFEGLIDFCSTENIDLNDMLNIENAQLCDVRGLIEAKQLCKCSKTQPKNETEEKSFIQLYRTLNDAGWEFAQLRQLVTAFNPAEPFRRFQNLLHFLNTIQIYNLSSSSNFEKIKQILANTTSFQEMIQKLNKLVIENHFQLEGKVKDLNELRVELKESNRSDSGLGSYIEAGSLDIRKYIFQEQADKLSWNEKQIYVWAKRIRGKQFSDNEAIAIILRANFLVTGHTLTDTQILSSLIALRREGNPKGKLLQIGTGEGKSTIICILAIIHALRNKRVDVITSSPVLAQRDAKQKAKLYRMFNLTCSDNSDKTVYIRGEKDCYKADIVYGEMSQFQFDILRDNYSKLGTLCKRQFMMAIVDEVDSMLIDDSSKIARLSSTVPGMDHFQALYVIIWQRLLAIKEKFIMFRNTMYFVYGKVGFENGKICLEIADANNDIVKIPDLELYLLNNDDVSQVAESVGDDIDAYLSKSLESYLDCQIKENRIYIPSNFQSFLQKQKSKWISNAVEALNYQENVHYVVQDGEIKPVDYFSTGIVQSSTSWSNGLHQFLQLKHNLKMTSETLTTNFLSNIGYMNRYEKVCGLTGTLGSETARSVFREVYRVDLVNIPQRRQKQYLELESVVAQGEADWLKEITANIMLEIQKDRGILVICETIEHANRISGMLKNKLRSSAIKLYTINDQEQEENVEKILSGQVIIATNLAGRGTDIQTDEIEATGGLHVILTFLPSNERVEGQAFGRTARQGKRGTGLMILNAHNLIGYDENTNSMKTERDRIELNQLKQFKEKELKLIQVKDKLFDKFCSFLNDEIRLTIREEQNSYGKKILNVFKDVQPTTYEVCALAAVEEQWADFLSKLDEETIKCENAENEYDTLIVQLRKDFKLKKFIKNPYHYVSIANDILVNEWFSTNASKGSRAIEYFKKAIELEERKEKEQKTSIIDEFGEQSDTDAENSKKKEEASKQNDESVFSSGAAHLGVAWCTILLQTENYKTDALSSFKTALKCLSNEMSVLNATQLLMEQKQDGFVNSDLYKQLNVKATILGSYLSSISACIDAIKRSKRMMDLVAVTKHKEKDRFALFDGQKDILETIEHFNELERDEKDKSCFKNKDLKMSDKKSYSLTFNHLTVREDSGTIDQALKMLDNAFDKDILKGTESELSKFSALKDKYVSSKFSCLDAESYGDIRINLKSIDLTKINSALFNPDKEFKDLTRETAISTLKAERSYLHALRFSNSLTTSLTLRSNDVRKLNQRYERDQINKLIEIVEEQKIGDEALRFDIVIKRANENYINILFESSVKSQSLVHLNVDFDNLNQEAVMAKLTSINATSYNVEFVLNKSDLLKMIKSNEKLEFGILYVQSARAFESVKREELLKRVGELKTDETPCFVRFEKLTVDRAKKIVESCHKNVLFAVSFVDIINFYGSLGHDDGQVNFSFDKLGRETAKKIIEVLRTENIEFSLEFKNLSDKEMRFILKNANLEQEHMEIRKVKNVRDLYAKINSPTLELNDFAAKGIEYIIEMTEKMFVPWNSVCAVAAIGVGQVILGGALIATGFGLTAGIGLVVEGIADIFVAYRLYSNRQFHWSDYCKQKAISLALSFATMGYSKWKEGAQGAVKGIQTLTTGAATEVLEQAGTQLISNRKVVGQVFIKTGTNLNCLACKFIGTKATEAVAKEALNTGFKCLSNYSFNLLKPQICESVQSRVRQSFCNPELKGFLRNMLAIDLVSNSRQLQSKVDQIVSDTVNPRHDFMRRQWDSIGLPLIKGVLSDSSRYGSTVSISIRFMSCLTGLYEVSTLTNNVADALVKKLSTVNMNSMSLALRICLKMSRDRVQVIVGMFNKLEIFDKNDNFHLPQDDMIENLKAKIVNLSNQWNQNRKAVLKELDSDESDIAIVNDVEKSIKFVERLFAKYDEIDFDSFIMIIASVSNQITDQLIRIIDSQMLQPFTALAVSCLVDGVSKRVQDALVDREQNSISHKADQEKYEQLFQKQDLMPDEKAFMASYGKYRTFVEQIRYNSRDYCDAYSQCEMAYYAGKGDSNRSSSANVNIKQTADNVRKGGPANVAVMITTAKANGVNLKVVDDPDYVRTQKDIDNDVQVIYVEPGSNAGFGHAYYMDSNGRFIEAQQTGFDCFFAAFSKILEHKGVNKSVDDLRAEAANRIELNSGNFSKVLSAENWIRKTHPDSANNLLFTAGLRKENEKILVEDGDTELLIEAIKNNYDKLFKGRYSKIFKDTVPETVGEVDEEGKPMVESVHHIVPKHLIRKIVEERASENPVRFRKTLEEFVNKKHISDVIGHMLDHDPLLQKVQHGILLCAATTMNPNNLVRGANRDYRAKDPGNLLDEEILGFQSSEYQKTAKTVYDNKDFDKFTNQETPMPLSWKRNKNKWVADQPLQNPADSDQPHNYDDDENTHTSTNNTDNVM